MVRKVKQTDFMNHTCQQGARCRGHRDSDASRSYLSFLMYFLIPVDGFN